MTEGFWTLHRDLPRGGPGAPEDVAWAVATAGVAPDARVLDAGAGPGGDVPALLAAVPGGTVTAVDTHADFVERLADLGHPRLVARQGDMADATGPFDFVWCAGAMYFHGIGPGLEAFGRALAPGGAVAFLEPVWLTATPPAEAAAFWASSPAMTDAAGIAAQVAAAGWRTEATRVLSDAAWEAYYGPLEARIAALRPEADADLAAALDATAAEIALWRAHGDAFGYLLSVVCPS